MRHIRPIERLLILARVTHYQHEGRLYAYTPYAREIELWADIFPQVMIAGTLRNEPPPGDCMAFARPNISILPVVEGGGHGLKARLEQFVTLPRMIWQVLMYLRQADAIHARVPCDLGCLGLIFGPLFSRRMVAKYATQWLPFEGEPLSWRLQRGLIKSWWWRGPVTVYGDWPGQPPKVIPFFTSVLSEAQLSRARIAAARQRDPSTLRVLFVGRLSESKNVDVLLKAVAGARTASRTITCTVIGEGPERASLEALAKTLGIADRVVFTGGLPFEDVLGHYEHADMLVLASNVEGWPKAVAEGMAFGLVCVGSARGLMPQMLGEGRGFIVPPRDVEKLREALEQVAADPQRAAQMALGAAAWAQRFSLENLRDSLRKLLEESWGTPLPPVVAGPIHLHEAQGGFKTVAESGVNGAARTPRQSAPANRARGSKAPEVLPAR